MMEEENHSMRTNCELASKSLRKRSIDTIKIEDQIEKIKTSLRQGGEKEIESREIGRLVMASLRVLDRVAYVFASVYRSF